MKTSHFKKRPLWLKPAVNNYHVLVSHRDQILELPQDSVLLAGNKHCPNAMYQTGQHFLGIQGHPEFTVEYALALMNSRSEDIGDDILIRARESLSTAADAKLLAKWIMSFLEKNKAEPRGSAFRGI
ncbi:MAG: hypothetical protein HRT88_00510 [Lentisphaeraceae bacterium]|nr:hypothetical protein [Lentisphaeraceae bacterium]